MPCGRRATAAWPSTRQDLARCRRRTGPAGARHERGGAGVASGLHPKKVSGLSVDYNDEVKRTNEIKTAAPMLEAIDIAGLDITADALLTQRDLAKYVVARGAHYHFSVKGNQPTLQDSIRLLFERRASAHHTELSAAEHGRIETRRIWCSSELNDYPDFPPRRPGLPYRA